MKIPALSALAVVASVAAVTPVFAADESALAASKNCLACHNVDRKIVGPAYKDVAKKYAGNPKAVEMLLSKVMKGGSGVWGPVPMPANTQINEAEAKRLIAWVLSLK